MRYEQRLERPDFTVKDVDILHVSRDTHYKHSYHNGRVKHGFIYTVKGRMENDFLDAPGERVSVEAGELIFIPEGCRYFGTYAEVGTEIMIVQFSLADGRLPHYLSSPVKLSFPKVGEAMEAFFKPNENHMVGSPYYYYACIYDLLREIDEVCGGLPIKYKKLQAALAAISACFYENCPMSHYADLCGMSEVSFRRLFKEYVGVSPLEYRNDLRLKNARIRLQSGEYNVSEAASSVGFSNLSFFIRLYKKKYGYTPKKE